MSLDEVFVLPASKDIAKIMQDVGLGHIDEKTHLSSQLGGKKKNILGVNMAWELAYEDYLADLGPMGKFAGRTTEMLKPAFMKELLKSANHEELFAVLVKNELCEEDG